MIILWALLIFPYLFVGKFFSVVANFIFLKDFQESDNWIARWFIFLFWPTFCLPIMLAIITDHEKR